MSLDIYLDSAPCPTCSHSRRIAEWNYTHNVAPMWRAAGCYSALYESEGATARSLLPAIEAAVTDMELHPDKYQPLNPSNGWGSYDTALPWLREVRDVFKANPDAVVSVWR